MRYIKTTLKTYNLYLSENNSNKLSNKLKLHTTTIPKYIKLNEIFDKELNLIKGKDFTIDSYKHRLYDELNYIYYFKLKDVEYRLDFVVIKENLNNKELKNKKFISISFSLKDVDDVDYDTPTELDNQYEVLNYVIHLVNYFKSKISEDYVFMFGDPKDGRKFNIYEYIIVKCFPDYRIIKDYTSGFSNTKEGFYLIKL